MQLSLVTVPWFMCLFVNTLRPEVTLRVWDMFFCEGSKVLFRISAALLKKNEAALIAASSRDCTELFLEMKNIGRNELDADALIAMAYKSYIPPSLKVKQRRIFTSRSTGHLHNMSGKGRLDPPLRKYNGHSGVPSHLIGMGVAHTGPVARLRIAESVAIALSPSLESSDPEPPFLYPPTECLSEKENIGEINTMWSIDSSSSSIGKDDILMSSSPLSTSCLSLFRTSSAPLPPTNGKDSYDADCCFDKSHAAAILQLGTSSFTGTGGEGRGTGVPNSISPSSITDINRTDSLAIPQDVKSQQSHPRTTTIPSSSSMSHATVSQKKKKVSQNSTSLFNMLLYTRQPSVTSGESSDEYRKFKRADIERLRADIRPALEERFLAFEKNRVARIRTDAESV
jgi:Rab-GTPase-TBC domain